MRCKILISLTLLLLSAYSFAQNFTNKGKEFWVGYGHHQYMEPSCDGSSAATNDMNMVLYLSAEEDAVVTVTIDSSGTAFVPAWKKTYVIPAFTVISTENLPKGSTNSGPSATDPLYDARLFDNAPPLGSGGENLWRKKGIHIESNVPIVAYAHIYGGVSSGATMLMPVETWGYSYTSVNSEQRDADRSYSWMYVVAKENNTLVQITPSAASRRGKPAGVPFNVLIQKGQIYQLVGQSDCGTGNGPELTGTTVKSLVGPDGKCHPVAVFGGSSRTGGETLTCGTGSGRDNDMQQLFPEIAWGKRFATAPFSKSQGGTLQPTQFQTSVYKVVVKDPSTVVTRNGVALTGIIGGKYYKYSSNTADYIIADKPIMMAQFMSGTTACNGGSGDPEMIILSPVEQAIKQVGFYRNTRQSIDANYLTLVVPTAGVTSLRIDNSGTFSHTYPHPRLAGYTVVVKGWVSAQSQCLVRCDSAFTAITYGLGGAESYGYNAGTYINNLTAIGAIHNTFDTTNTTNSFTCTRTPVELSVLMSYKPLQMEWLLSRLSTVITPNANVIVNPPVVVDSPLVNGIKYYKYTLPGNFQFSDTGTFKIPIVVTSPSIDNCTLTDTVYYDITVKGKPVGDFTYTHAGCYTDTVYFAGSGSGGNYTINRWRWTFLGTDKDSIQNPKRVFPVGTHNVKLQVISQEGCLGDTVKQVIISPPAATDFTITPGSLCEPSTYNFTSVTPLGAGTTYYWDLGNGSTAASNTASTVYNSYGSYTIKHIAKVTGQCPSDTVRKTITIFAKPRVNFGYPVGCLPADGIAQFSDATVIPDGQVLTYAWDFGDAANANAGNPNTATTKNPSHKYIAFGTYNIKLTVTTANGCSKDTTIACTFAVRPTLAFAPLTSVCTNNGVISVARGSTTNGVPGTGLYSGPGTDAAGNFNPTTAGSGVKTIWYVFTSTGGCKDSVSQTIKVHPKPITGFALSDTVFCLNKFTRITDTSKISGGIITTWKWDFGDGTFADLTNNTPFNRFYGAPGNYTIKLVAVSDSSCISDTASRLVKVDPIPVASFNFTHTGCRLDTVYFTSTVPPNTYTVSKWKWVFSNGDTSILENPKMVFAAGTFTARLTITTTGGCTDDTVRTFTVFAPPVSGITASPLTQCEPGTVNLSDASTYGGTGSIVGSYWDYGNGQTVTNANNSAVIGTYPVYGTYTIKHLVKVSNLCISDTGTKTITVFAKPRVNFGYPVGCLALDGTAQFSDSTVIPDGQLVTYAWDFGDAANSNAGNPNTATSKNPTHKYIAFGTYNIKLTVTTANGCSKDTTIACTFAVRPTLAFARLTSVCANSPIVSVAKGSTTNGVPGTSIYRGPGTDAAGNFNPTLAGAGVKTIWFVFTSTGGCTDSLSQTIKVHPKPVTGFALSDTVFCLNKFTRITDTSKITSGAITTWKWDFGDGTFADLTSNTPFNRFYGASGSYTVKLVAVSDSSCISDTASKLVKVDPIPVASFNFTHTGCRLDTVYFASTVPSNTYTVSKWKWVFSNGDTSILENPKMVFAAGTFTARLTITTTGGCTDDTVRTFTVFAPPVSGITASPLTQCEPGTITLSDASTYGGTGSIVGSYWDYGNGQTVTNTNNSGVTASYPVYGTYTIKHTVKVSDLCVSDTGTRVVTIFAKPRVNFGYPVGCLPLDNTARFTDSTIIPDGQAATYAWDFGDAAASTGANPNTSNAKNPSHIYINYGTYNIKLTVTTANGCSKDTTIIATFAVRPLMAFAPLSSVCVNAGLVSIAKGSVTNGVPGTGIYKGPGTNAAGNFDPLIAGVGVKTIWYTFTSTGNCTDSISQTIIVNPKPVADITLSRSSFCLDASTVLTGSSAITTGSTTSYRWNFGDGTTVNNTTNAPITKSYTVFGPYTIKLVTISDSNCVSDTVSKPIVVNPLPIVDFTLPAGICMPAGKAQFTSLATIPGNTSLTYTWNFGDGSATSPAKDPLHIYNAIGSYSVRLTATSANGCVDDSVKTLSSFFAQPVASFAVTPDVFCQGTPNVFNDFSVAPNSTITSYNWSFGDGTTSTLPRPQKQFNQPGSYDIKLLVTSAQGCVSDTFSRTVTVYLQPVINAGPSFTVPSGQTVIFRPVANDTTNLRFFWSPSFDFSDATKFRQSLVALRNQVYYLTAVGEGNCTATDSLTVKVLKPFKVPNVFSPNGDGINDTWTIPELADYFGARVTIFNRYGNEVLSVTGYSTAWDGTMGGKPLPVGVYYYVIDPKNGFKPFTGSVTILR